MDNLSNELRQKAAKIIQAGFENAGIGIELDSESILPQTYQGFLNLRSTFERTGSSPFDRLLDSVAYDRRGEHKLLFHFRSPAFAESILSTYRVQISNLASQSDDKEFSQFCEESGLWHPQHGFYHLPLDYDGQPEKCLSPEGVREQVYGMCFTKKLGNPRFWEDYAEHGTGVCLILEVKDVSADVAGRQFYHLRDVGYTNGQKFSFLKRIQEELLASVGLPLNFLRVPVFAAFTNRDSMSWEEEIRLVIDYLSIQFGFAENPDLEFTCADVDKKNGRDRIYLSTPIIRLPFHDEAHFKIRLRGIVWGPHIEPSFQARLQEKADQNFPGIFTTSSEDEAGEFARTYPFPEDEIETMDTMELLGLTMKRRTRGRHPTQIK